MLSSRGWAWQARRDSGKFDLSVDAGAGVLKLGTSVDLGFCNAQKKARDLHV